MKLQQVLGEVVEQSIDLVRGLAGATGDLEPDPLDKFFTNWGHPLPVGHQSDW